MSIRSLFAAGAILGSSAACGLGSGVIEARGLAGTVDVRTGAGSIVLSGRPGGDWDVEADVGSVRLTLTPDSAFVLNAHARVGSVRTTHPFLRADAISQQRAAGGPTIDVAVRVGSIRVE